MIVGRLFDGDEDDALAWKQHDVHSEALGIMMATCNRFTRFAQIVLADGNCNDWEQVKRCDHRTLQGVHDLLAAAWRFRNGSRQGLLPLEDSGDSLSAERTWLNWLQRELSSWIEEPWLVQFLRLILVKQNEPLGHAAEIRLCLALLDRFAEVPWKQSWRDAYEAAASEGPPAIRSDPGEAANVVWFPAVCACIAQGLPPCNQSPCATWQRSYHQSGAEPRE